MTIDIKRGVSTILSPNIDDSSVLHKLLNGADIITLNFSWDSFTEILINDKITWGGIDYFCSEAPAFRKVSEVKYEYSITFEGPQYNLKNALFLLDGQGEFDLVGTAEDFVDLIVTNLNRVFGGGTYSSGSIYSTDYMNLHFSGESCFTVLKRICDEFELEFYFSGSGYVINLTDEIGNATGLTFQYADGLRNIRRTKVGDKDLITRLYPFGSDKNIETTYGSKRLKLPIGTYPNGYMEQNTGSYGIREAVKLFEDIFPHFEGVVDSSAYINQITDAAIDFDLNDYFIEGVVAKIVFNTGDLAGYEFEISLYIHETKTVFFNYYTDEQGLVLPNATLKPAAGDKYTFVDIKMPAAYITAAESALASEALSYLDEMSSPNVLYDIEMDWHELMKDTVSLDVGDEITVTDAQLAPGGVTFRILELTQSLANEYKYSVKVGESLLLNYFQKVAARQTRSERNIIVNDNTDVIRVRREYLRTEELRDTIFDPDGYFDTANIKPLSIETGMLAVGMKSQQFVLKNVRFYPNYGGDAAHLEISAGDLVHLTIDATIKTWSLSSGSFPSLVAGSTYYIYARCDRDGATGVWFCSTNQYKVTEGSTDWYFLIGVVHSVVDSVRAISLTYGHTTVNGKFITTGKISSQDGSTYFDLDGNIIQGKITFVSGTSGYDNITDTPTELADINTSEAEKLSHAENYKFFSFKDGSDGGFTSVGCTGVDYDNGGSRKFTATGSPNQHNSGQIDIKGAEAYMIKVRFILLTLGGSSWKGHCYYRTAGHSWTTSYYKTFSQPTLNVWTEITLDMRTLTAGGTDYMDNDILGIRFDWTTGSGAQWVIDWIGMGTFGSADMTKTVIDGGIITTGRIELGDGATIKSGIYGGGVLGTDIRIWAGDTFANRATAPFRVNQAGEVNATAGAIAGWIIDAEAIFKGTKVTSGYTALAGEITLHSQGSIHMPNFYVNADGEMGIRAKEIIFAYVGVSNTVILSHDSGVFETGGIYVKKKTITLGANVRAGRTLRIKFDLAVAIGTETAYGRIYRNGVAVGSEWTETSITFQTKQQDIAGWNAGDTIEFWMKVSPTGGGQQALAQNFRVCGILAVVVNEITGAYS